MRWGPARLVLSPPLAQAVARFDPDVVLWTDYPETEGMTAYPFHTKARNLARLLVRPERLASLDLSRPLRNTIDFSAPREVQAAGRCALRQHVPAAASLCVISRTGVTASRKNWGDGWEARDFVAAMRREEAQLAFHIDGRGGSWAIGLPAFAASLAISTSPSLE